VPQPQPSGSTPPATTFRASLGKELKLLLLLQARRNGAALAVKAVARRISVSSASLYAYLAGTTLPPVDRLDDLLTELNATPAQRVRLQDLRDQLEVMYSAKDRESRAGGVDEVTDSGPPVIEIAHADGSVEIADILDVQDVPADDVDLAGGYEIEQLTEQVSVDERRTINRVACSRTIRAAVPGVERFLYSMECPPDSGLRRVVIEPGGAATVSKVVRLTASAYVFHLRLPAPLPAGETAELQFSISTVEADSHVERDVYGKRQFVATESVHLFMRFAQTAQPVRVRWFASAFPLGNFPDGFSFPEDTGLQPSPDGSYEKVFQKTDLPLGRIVGMVWDYS
jgi:hypothetical protein